MNRTLSCTILLVASVVLGACASMPDELASGGPYLDIRPSQALNGEYDQQRVRWGGVVIQTLPQGQQTCFEMAGLTVDSGGEPIENDTSTGRFMACADGFYEPAIYSEGRYVTFTGHIEGSAPHEIGNQTFEFPKLKASQVYLWPKRREVIYVPYPSYGYPYGGHYWLGPRYHY